ncbi:MAG TPA: FHA domain-containing protein, partial [Pseudomonadales bacterium]|nr:FHA domain-containing protein [Pseudomonadales bacterium]
MLDTSTVDESHARIVQHDGKLFLQDNKSQRGCFVNGKKVKYKDLRRGDLISIGNVHFEIVESDDNDLTSTRISIPVNTHAPRSAVHTAASWRLISDSSWLSGKVFELQNDTTLLGRGKDCDIVIPGNHLSRRHAQILRHNDYLTVMDLDSANGSYVNDVALTSSRALRHGDRIQLGTLMLYFDQDESGSTQDLVGGKTQMLRTAVNLPVKTVQATLLVGDLKNFTSISAQLTAEEVAAMLREWYAD